jgi:hypothetical protein
MPTCVVIYFEGCQQIFMKAKWASEIDKQLNHRHFYILTCPQVNFLTCWTSWLERSHTFWWSQVGIFIFPFKGFQHFYKGENYHQNSSVSQLDKQVLFHKIVSIFVYGYNKEQSSWYLAKMRHQVDVYLISFWSLYLFDLILMSWSWKIDVKMTSNRWL